MKPSCKIIGEDGNVFSIIGKVTLALRDAGLGEKGKEFSGRAFLSSSYDEVLRLAMKYVEVE